MKPPPSAMREGVKTGGYEKSREQFLAVFRRHLASCNIHTDEKVLVIGGNRQDAELLLKVGFRDITLSNLNSELEENAYANLGARLQLLAIDAEQIGLPDGSFDFVFAHEVLHHCRSHIRVFRESRGDRRRLMFFLRRTNYLFFVLIIIT